MPLIALLCLVATPPQDVADLSVAPTADIVRLARTPRLDGMIEPDEWQLFASTDDAKTYFQWEPGKFHVGGMLPAGSRLVLSLDLQGDGWLVGRDNYEVTLSMVGGQPEVQARQLDASRLEGPAWVALPGFLDATRVAAVQRGDTWTVEATLADSGYYVFPTDADKNIRLRIDAVEQDLPLYGPRATSLASLRYTMSKNIVPGAVWKPEFRTLTVTPGEEYRIRYTWSFGPEGAGIRQIDMRTEGPAGDHVAAITRPFPELDKKKRAFVDYQTRVAEGAPLGYHVLRGTAETFEAEPYTMYTSFRIAPLVDFEVVPLSKLRSKDEPQTVKLTTYIRSNSPKRLDGEMTLDLPTGWEAKTGQYKRFIIYSPRGGVRRVSEVVVPAGAKGVYPLTYRATIGSTVVDQTVWVRIQE